MIPLWAILIPTCHAISDYAPLETGSPLTMRIRHECDTNTRRCEKGTLAAYGKTNNQSDLASGPNTDLIRALIWLYMDI